MRCLTFFLFFLCAFCEAQITFPKASPFSIIEQEIGLSKIRIEYSRPAVRGRHVFGPQDDGQKGLVPFGRIWRVGANESTKIIIDTDMEVMNNTLPKGSYALYAFPEEAHWEVVFHTNTSHWGDGRTNYNPDQDAFRIQVKPEILPYHQENFLISFDSITHNSAQLKLLWDRTQVSIPFTVDTHSQMELEIQKQLNENPTAQTYYQAARYLQEQGIDFERALNYLNKAIALEGDTYYFHRVKSLVQAELRDYRAAIASAEKSMHIASALGKDEFVRMNQKNIVKWTSMVKK